ncbi:hypothetical protein R3P38DRAFT_3222035 [Favolaschia claudopus]|uniref:Uncharacterized protein n=1 Tax=Favolaschia claudopus TaxID=2862362 RepID=A0AAV9ZZG7_9AGAR
MAPNRTPSIPTLSLRPYNILAHVSFSSFSAVAVPYRYDLHSLCALAPAPSPSSDLPGCVPGREGQTQVDIESWWGRKWRRGWGVLSHWNTWTFCVTVFPLPWTEAALDYFKAGYSSGRSSSS